MDEPGWHLYRSLLAVLRTGSLSGAARVLALTQPTLGRHIAELEESLGLALFTRSPGGLAPTEEAERLRPSAEALEFSVQELLSAARAGASEAVVGTVRITASEVIGTHVLPAALEGALHAHPGLAVEVRLANRVEDLLRRDADIAVRGRRPEQHAIVAKKLGAIRLGLFAHKSYVAHYGCPANPSQLKSHRLIGFDADESRGGTQASTSSLGSLRRGDFQFRSDSLLAQNAAVRAGVGIGAMQRRLASEDSNLVPILSNQVEFSFELWLAMHEDQRGRAPVRYVFDSLAEALSAWCRT